MIKIVTEDFRKLFFKGTQVGYNLHVKLPLLGDPL
jgi:hypothetical protein